MFQCEVLNECKVLDKDSSHTPLQDITGPGGVYGSPVHRLLQAYNSEVLTTVDIQSYVNQVDISFMVTSPKLNEFFFYICFSF